MTLLEASWDFEKNQCHSISHPQVRWNRIPVFAKNLKNVVSLGHYHLLQQLILFDYLMKKDLEMIHRFRSMELNRLGFFWLALGSTKAGICLSLTTEHSCWTSKNCLGKELFWGESPHKFELSVVWKSEGFASSDICLPNNWSRERICWSFNMANFCKKRLQKVSINSDL